MTVLQQHRWLPAPPADPELLARLTSAVDIPEVLAALLVQRGFTSIDDTRRYLRPPLEDLSDPYQLRDMDRAVATIGRVVRGGGRILVHGDYDVDGQCAAALLTRVLREAGADVEAMVPHRLRDGYDFGPAGVARARELNAALVITCDCGTTAVDAVRQTRAEGRAVVVTDHHLTHELPDADAVINPQQPGCASMSKQLCGAGVAFKLVQALVPELRLPANLPFHFLDLVALATVADLVPLTGENRILVRHGLKLLSETRSAGVRALLRVTGLEHRSVRAGQVGFILAPRLNAAGRIGDAMDGLRLLLTDDDREAQRLATLLDTVNARRQAIDEEILQQALEDIERIVDLESRFSLVLAREGWHPGVIGLVASRVVERFTRPTILVALDGEEGRGSGRSISGFDLHAALTRCAPHLARYGGHKMAAGLNVRRDRLDAFRDEFDAVAHEQLTPDDLVPTQRIDLVVTVSQLTDQLERLLRYLEPTGIGNPGAVLGVSGARAVAPGVVGANHLKFRIDDTTGRVDAIAFGWADRVEKDWLSDRLDIALRLETNEFRGMSRLQARVVHLKPSDWTFRR
jgi:single-stranded-DNA-specific exonuclease